MGLVVTLFHVNISNVQYLTVNSVLATK